MRPVFKFLVRQRPLVVGLIITAAKKEVRRSRTRSEKSRDDKTIRDIMILTKPNQTTCVAVTMPKVML